MVYFGLVYSHYDAKNERYTLVREQQGGGRRVQLVNRYAIFQEMFQQTIDVLFIKGLIYKYCLGDYALQEITKIIYLKKEAFTLEN